MEIKNKLKKTTVLTLNESETDALKIILAPSSKEQDMNEGCTSEQADFLYDLYSKL